MKNILNILIAPDKFKGSLSAQRVAESIAVGIRKNYPDARIELQPMADGGDGSIDLLNELWKLTEHRVEVHDPLFRKITTSYFSNETDAFIEMAKASSLALLKEEERNPMKTTSLGTGELILHALQKGIKNINLFIGGSATNDAAIGIATALGYQFFDKNNKSLLPVGENLLKVESIKSNRSVHGDGFRQMLRHSKIKIICDVNNPFFGENGAAWVYAGQKGASDLMIKKLDAGLKNMDAVFENQGFGSVQHLPGAGAAGGIGGGMFALFGAELIQGIDLFIERFDLENKVINADFVISGEGQLDFQSLQGKVVGGISKLCKKYGKPLMVVCGQNKLTTTDFYEIKSIMELAPSTEQAMNEASVFLEEIGARLRFKI
ncbi:MAG: glycerate kinase [Saprospiraceae bacterium]|nr:MAG: glycerate kinase [Saprospiraceae bacterium]